MIESISLEQAASLLDLRRYGSQYRGPCPVCGGSERATKFRLREHNGRLSWECYAGCGDAELTKELADRGVINFLREDKPAGPPQISDKEYLYHQMVVVIAWQDWQTKQITEWALVAKSIAILRQQKRVMPVSLRRAAKRVTAIIEMQKRARS